ncbi:MAG: AAA family ATPase [Pseudomonadales bacterium]|nr:AAA family ATPase [Pseudomonadales bacterium]
MPRAVKALVNGELEPIPSTHILVDEFQDIDKIQLDWVLYHKRRGVEITAVGDDDQSIYKFRDALGYTAFKLLHNAIYPKVIYLDTNYRCAKKILATSNALITANTGRIQKNITPIQSGGSVATVEAWTQEDEIDAIVKYQSRTKTELAVIARTHGLLERIAYEFEVNDISFNRPGGKDFWDLPLPALLSSLLQRTKVDGLVEVTLESTASTPDFTELDAILRAGEANIDRKIQRTTDWIERVVLPGYEEKWHSDTLRRASSSLLGFTGSVLRRLAGLKKRKKNAESKLTLLTMHSAKGLEFENVWVFGCNDGRVPLIPKGKTIDAEEIEEERRLLYVAMTRARKELTLSFSWNRGIRKPELRILQRLYPSRFLTDELGIAQARPTPPEQYREYRYWKG